MKDSRRSTLLAIVLLLTASLPAQADAVDDFIRAEMSRRHIPGLSLAIVKDGRLIRSQGYGLANVELKVPATPDGVQIGSMTKQFTACCDDAADRESKVSLAETN